MNRTTGSFGRVAVLAIAALVTATSGFATQWLDTAVDPTCAVIQSAEYNADHRWIRITGRSSEAVTVRIYDRNTTDPLVVARRSDAGEWTLEFDLIGKDSTPGMVIVQGISGCATFRLVNEDRFGQVPQADRGIVRAALPPDTPHGELQNAIR